MSSVISRRIQRSKSPRSVTTWENFSGCPSPPKQQQQQQQQLKCDDETCPAATSTQSLLKLNRAVRIWRCHSLDSRNRSQKQRNSRRVRKTVSFPTTSSSSATTTTAIARVREFDPRNSVLSVSDDSHVFAEDLVPQTPWYDQEYEEMPWWEYPDLNEDDEITVLCKKVARSRDPVYVDRVEALVWTAVVKLQNVARFVLQKQKEEQTPNQPAINNSQSPAALLLSQQMQPKARAQVPAMFMGLPREVQAEKRRYRRSSNDTDMPEKPTVTKPQNNNNVVVQDTKPAAPASRRVIRRTVATSSQKKNEDITPTPAAVFVRSPAAVSPKLYSSPANPTKMRIQKLKEQQQAVKEEQERVNKKMMEQQEATQRLEAQQRRLERLRNRSMSS